MRTDASELRHWLGEIGLGHRAELFVEQGLDFDVLGDLTEADLKELGLSLGDRKRLIRAIAERGTPTPVAPARADRVRDGSAPAEAERRQMTIVFIDMVGSTALANQLDPEDMFNVLAAYQSCCARVVTEFGGHVAKYLGDGVLAFFGFPKASEDDAERSVRAAMEVVSAVALLSTSPPVELRCRVGIDTGLVVMGDLFSRGAGDDETVVGGTMNLAARLQACAPPDGIVISDRTRRLVGPLFTFKDIGAPELKGFEEPVQAWLVTGESTAEGRFEAHTGAGLTPLVARANEFNLLLERWRLARDGEGQVVLLAGEGGIGKSRLVDSLSREIADEPHGRLRFFCSPFYSSTALYSVAEHVKRAAGFLRNDDADARIDKLGELIAKSGIVVPHALALLARLCAVPLPAGHDEPALSPPERKTATFEVLLGYLERLTASGPQLIVFEDAHWCDPTTVELLGLMMDRVQRLSALLLLTHRPEFTPPWRMRPHVTTLQLTRMGRAQCLELMERVAGGRQLPEAVQQLLLEKTDGIPLYVEELTKTLLETGVLAEERGRWVQTGPLPAIAVPSTLQDSLMARLDRLQEGKEVALWASALGRTFGFDMLAAVVPSGEAKVRSALARLIDAEMIYQHGLPPEEVYEFKHALLQDAAYTSMVRGRRQEMHTRIADVLEKSFPELADVRPEIMVQHLRSAGRLQEAIGYAFKAGERAAETYAAAEARLHYDTALMLARQLPPTPEAQRAEIRAVLKRASVSVQRDDLEQDLIDLERARGLAEQLDHRPRLAQISYWVGRLNYVAGRFDAAIEFAERSAVIADEIGGDERLSAAAVNLLARTFCLRGEPSRGVAFAARNAEQMERVGNAREEAAITGVLAFALALHGRFDDAFEAADRGVALADRLDHLPTRAACHFFKGVAHGWFGDLDTARPSYEEAFRLAEAAGDMFRCHLAHGWRGEALVHAGVLDAAEADLTRCLELGEQLGSRYHEGAFRAFFAKSQLELGRPDRALAESEQALHRTEDEGQEWGRSIALRVRAEVIGTLEPTRLAEAGRLLDEAHRLQTERELRYDLLWTEVTRARLLLSAGDRNAPRVLDDLRRLAESIGMDWVLGRLPAISPSATAGVGEA